MNPVSTTVVDNTAASRFELRLDGGEVASFAEYAISDGVMILPHTVTQPRHQGQGFAAIVIRHALDTARAANLQVAPACWFAAESIRDHPEYADLVRRAG